MYQPRNNPDDKAMNSAETATLRLDDCFKNGHFAPKPGENVGEGYPSSGSLSQQLLDGVEGLCLALGPIALDDL